MPFGLKSGGTALASQSQWGSSNRQLNARVNTSVVRLAINVRNDSGVDWFALCGTQNIVNDRVL